MKIKLRKKQEQKIAEKSGKEPRIYIVKVGESYSLYERFTHSYLESVQSEKELVELLTEWHSISERDFWEVLVKDGQVRPQHLTIDISGKDNEAEKMYQGAWKFYTEKFYEAHPEIKTCVSGIPLQLVKEIREGIYNERVKKVKELERERMAFSQKEQIEKEKAKLIDKAEKEMAEENRRKVIQRKKKKATQDEDKGYAIPVISDFPF